MARAILLQGLNAGVIVAGNTVVAEPDPLKRTVFTDAGFAAVGTAAAAARLAEEMSDAAGVPAMWLLAVKPQSFAGLASELRESGVSPDHRTVISIMAGLTVAAVGRGLGCSSFSRIVRTMPNLGATVGKGVTAIAQPSGADSESLAAAENLMGCLGPCVERVPEGLVDAFTAVAGSGPAYVFYLAEAMIDAAKSLGFEAAVADRIVRGTIEGAASLMSQSRASPSELRAGVTSRGGTTQAATESMEANQVRESIVTAIEAGAKRAKELAG